MFWDSGTGASSDRPLKGDTRDVSFWRLGWHMSQSGEWTTQEQKDEEIRNEAVGDCAKPDCCGEMMRDGSRCQHYLRNLAQRE